MVAIRQQTAEDDLAVYRVNAQAFGRDVEARLVEGLRANPDYVPELSLVAEVGGEIVGHILFSPISIEVAKEAIPAISLAPLAVLPEHQNMGIGSALVMRGLEACCSLGHRIVIVLGHPNYYPRFGFSTELAKELACPFGEAGDAWMAIELQLGALRGVRGKVHYPKQFENV